MKPEDIDKLFKERLGNTSPTPPADLWSRLQERMEEELPAQPQEKKRSLMWLSSSIAASVLLLLAIGLVLYNLRSGKPELRVVMQEQQQPAIFEQQPAAPAVQAPAAPAPASIAGAPDAAEKENNLLPQATTPASAASNSSKALANVSTKLAKPRTKMKKATTPIAPAPTPQLALADSKPKEQPAAAAAPTEAPEVQAVFASATADAAVGAEPVEIIFKRTVNTQPVVAEAPSDRKKKVRLAKNIFKQVRNLSNGEPVELSSLGIRADKIALETKIGNQKISKVINL